MKKFYALALSILAMMLLGNLPTANAQGTRTMADYIVRTVPNVWNELDEATGATRITSLDNTGWQSPYNFGYFKVSEEITVPFQFLFANIPDAQKVKVFGDGEVMVSSRADPNPPATPVTTSGITTFNYYYGMGYSFYYTGSSTTDVNYPNYRMSPWGGGYTTYIPQGELDAGREDFASSYSYQTFGTAPNRTFVVQANNLASWVEYGVVAFGNGQARKQGSVASWQTVIYEGSSIPSKIRFYFKLKQGNGANWTLDQGTAFGAGFTGYNYYYPMICGIKAAGNNGSGNSFIAVNNGASRTLAAGTVLTQNTHFTRTEAVYAQSPYDVETTKIPEAVSYEFAIYYNTNLAWTNPNFNPPDNSLRAINVAFTPSATLTNEGKNQIQTATVNLTITQIGVGVVYNNSVTISPNGDTRLGSPYGGVGTVITMPNYTPTAYGLYTSTWTISGVQSSPGLLTEDYLADNVVTTTWTCSPPNNLRSVGMVNPTNGSKIPLNVGVPITWRFHNTGANNQTVGRVSLYIKNSSGAVVYRDSITIADFLSNTFREVTFRDFTATQQGTYTLCGVTLLSNDQLPLDDTSCGTLLGRYEADVAAVSVFDPEEDSEKPEGKGFQPIGIFQTVGVRDLFDIKARVIIRRCADNTIVFQADSNPGIPELNTDDGAKKFSFPSKQGTFDTRNLAPGCYKLCVIALLPDDGDRTNDTACTQFSVIPRLSGNINVGVGQRFRTISATVDSLLYRGVKAPGVNLILTDLSYTEDGTHAKVSTPTAAISFAGRPGAFDLGPQFPSLGIEGVGPNAMVTWKPKPNVSPVITFTGSKQNCFEIGYKSLNWMKWDGNNQTVQSLDQITREPAKRNITIINNSTTAGSIFAVQHGRDHLTFKSLRLKNNGNLNSAASSAINISNVYDFASNQSGVKDTAAHSFIVIDNNEIGNAAYGISDMGTIPLFNIGKAVFEDRRNNNNRISRNTIGSQAWPVGNYGIFFANEDGLLVDRNEVSWVTGGTSATTTAGIAAANGNSINTWINGNKLHNIGGTATTYGVWSSQASTIYQVGSGPTARKSVLPVQTRNRVTSNFIFDLRNATPASIFPVLSTTGATNYTVELDSIFNNSISVANSSATITVMRTAKPFIWNNIIENLNGAANVNAVQYSLSVPRPWAMNISSDYNLHRLLASNSFATVSEYDRPSGTTIQSTTIKSLNDWRTYTQQDINSILGTATLNDPRFTTDSLHLPPAVSRVISPASNAGRYFSSTQAMDIDGEQRLTDNPDMGADEFDGFQWNNDLGVQAILQPTGLTDGNGNIVVTDENPVNIQAIVKNLGGISVLQRNVTAKYESSTNGGATWSLIWQSAPQKYDFDVAQSRIIDFTGTNLTAAPNTIFRVTVFVDADQNNANNSLSKIFTLTLKKQAVVVSYESTTAKGIQNRDSVTRALRRLGVAYDSIDRASFGSNVIDYTPWWTLIWSTGNPTQTYANGLGIGAVSLKETEEIIRFLRAGQTWAKKSFIIAGQNVAQYNDPASPLSALNNSITDLEFMRQWMHVMYKKDQPGWNYPSPGVPTTYRDALKGTGVYFVFSDSITALSPDVITVYPVTGPVGSDLTRIAYTYTSHSASPMDSGAGTAFTSPTNNVVFYPFDWADALQTVGTRDGEPTQAPQPVNTSGTTRFLRGALDFIQSYKGIVLPVEFGEIRGDAKANGNEISWEVPNEVNVDHYEIEVLNGDNWSYVGDVKASNAKGYSFTHGTADAFEAKTYTYRVVGVDLDGSKSISPTVNIGRTAEGLTMTLEQNYPNPFTASTNIKFTLSESGMVSVRIMDMTGKVIATMLSGEELNAGMHERMFTANNLATGTYIYELSFTSADGKTSSITKMMTLKK